MKRCSKCNVPLDGFLSNVPRLFFGVKPSTKKKGLCNKCESKK